MGRPLKIAKSATTDTGYPAASPGVVGGNTGISGNQVRARVKIGDQAEANGYILRQKGKKKFLVASVTAIQDEDIVANNTYVITSVSNTDWTYFGVTNAAVGRVFTAPRSGTGLTTNGVVNRVGTCTLVNVANSSLTSNTMTVECGFANLSAFKAKTLTNKFVTDFSNVKYFASFTGASDSTTPYKTVTVDKA